MGATAVPNFVPFEQFRDQIRSARRDQIAAAVQQVMAPAARALGAPPTAVRDWAHQESDAIVEFVSELYESATVTNSFADKDGMPIDCLTFESQPALQGKAPALQPRPPALLDPEGAASAASPRSAYLEPPLAEGKADHLGNEQFCPPGSIPKVRVSPERIAHAGGLARFLRKAPDGGQHPILGKADGQAGDRGGPAPQAPSAPPYIAPPMQVVGNAIHAYAHAFQLNVPNVGIRTWFNVWNPNPSPGVFSLSQLWLTGGSGGGLQTIEGGWHVYPDLFQGSTLTRLFLFSTPDGYQSGAYNLQGGFIQVDNTWVIGGSFDASGPGGDQRGFLMQWQRDAQGNWWLFLGGSGAPAAVGYYPVALYRGGQLSQYAEMIDFGGEVCGQQNGRQTGEMGSGRPASAGWQQAAFQRACAYLDAQSGRMVTATLTPDPRNDAPCYTLDAHTGSGDWASYFFFGGGGCQF
jgi:hypothetical protein